jgi:quercetin dioxygenase-like cupin family protein
MRYAMQSADRPDGRRFEVEHFTQRLLHLSGDHGDDGRDEVLYVLQGSGRVSIGGEEHPVHPGVALFISRGTRWSASGDASAVSVLIHEPLPSEGHAVLDLGEMERGTATAGRAFLLGATPECGCASVTQFVGLIPPGRAPEHFHKYDEVIYILEGHGELVIGDETAPLEPGSCVHLPRTLVHCLANTGDGEMRVLGVFRPAGSPAEAYYPDGTLAAVPHGEEM